MVQRLDLTSSSHWADPKLAITPDSEDGPVLITVEYRVPAERASDFLEAMEAMRIFRRREGAVRWDLFRDLADPGRYLETFVVLSWGEHMRQHARVTAEDKAIEARAFAFQQEVSSWSPLTSSPPERTVAGHRQSPLTQNYHNRED